MKNKHTTGPWTKARYKIEGNNGQTIVCRISTEISTSESIANRDLISAAPELLEVLEHTLKVIQSGGYMNCDNIEKIVAAISKAKGY